MDTKHTRQVAESGVCVWVCVCVCWMSKQHQHPLHKTSLTLLPSMAKTYFVGRALKVTMALENVRHPIHIIFPIHSSEHIKVVVIINYIVIWADA